MDIKKYIGDIIGGSLFIAESRVVAELLLQNLSAKDFRHAIEEGNVLQKRSPHTALRYASTIRKRLEPMGSEFMEWLLHANEEVAKQLLMAAFLNQSPMALDFMRQQLSDARRTMQDKLSDFAWLEFVDDRTRAMPELARYAESSIKRMGNSMIKALADSGYLRSAHNKELQTVFLDPDVHSWLLRNNFDTVAHVMEGTE